MSDLYLFSAREIAQQRLKHITDELAEADREFGQKACVYATGSFGRLDSGKNSDLDLFIVIETDANADNRPLLNAVDEVKLKYRLIEVAEDSRVAKFDGGGRFLTSHTIESFTSWLGSNEDDYRNTLTGRMLMLLESKPLIGKSVYLKTINLVIDKYFRDYFGHENNFVPSFLFNDIIRMWRTFCVNYEFYRKGGDSRGKIKNLKLKFSRMLTCYSGIVYLMAIYAKNGHICPDDVRKMVEISPTERLEVVAVYDFGFNKNIAEKLSESGKTALRCYSEFLELSHRGERAAVKEYNSDEAKWREKSYDFGRCLSTMIDALGDVSLKADGLRRLILI